MRRDCRILVLAAQSGHSDQNSIYAILNQLLADPGSKSIDVASRGTKEHHHLQKEILKHPNTELRQLVNKGEKNTELRNVFRRKIQQYYAPEDEIAIGKSVSLANQSGGRILYLGIIKKYNYGKTQSYKRL